MIPTDYYSKMVITSWVQELCRIHTFLARIHTSDDFSWRQFYQFFGGLLSKTDDSSLSFAGEELLIFANFSQTMLADRRLASDLYPMMHDLLDDLSRYIQID